MRAYVFIFYQTIRQSQPNDSQFELLLCLAERERPRIVHWNPRIPESRTTTAADLSPPALDKGKLPDKLKNDVFYHMQVQSMDRMDQLDKDVLSIKNSLSEVVEFMKSSANHTSSLAHTGPKATLEDTSSESNEDEDDA